MKIHKIVEAVVVGLMAASLAFLPVFGAESADSTFEGGSVPAQSQSAAKPFKLSLFGDQAEGKDIYRTKAEAIISPTDPSAKPLIRENGIWMSLAPDKDGIYRVVFLEERLYELGFCVQFPDGQRSQVEEVRFRVGGDLADLLDRWKDLETLLWETDQDVKAKSQEIIEFYREYNSLTEEERGYFSALQQDRIQVLVGWLGRLQPTVDITPPTAPVWSYSVPQRWDMDIFPVGLEIKLDLPVQADVDKVCVRQTEEWQEVQKGENGYVLTINQPGYYTFSFCTEDTAGNRSPSQEASLVVSDELYEFLGTVDSSDSQSIEQGLKQYYGMDIGSRLSLEPLLPTLWQSYTQFLNQMGMVWSCQLGEAEKMEAVGMLAAFPDGTTQIQVSGQTDHKSIPNCETLYRYDVTFQNRSTLEEVQPQTPVLLRVSLPGSLLGKKNVEIYDKSGKALDTHVRNEEQGMVLEFEITKGGSYYFTTHPDNDENTSG